MTEKLGLEALCARARRTSSPPTCMAECHAVLASVNPPPVGPGGRDRVRFGRRRLEPSRPQGGWLQARGAWASITAHTSWRHSASAAAAQPHREGRDRWILGKECDLRLRTPLAFPPPWLFAPRSFGRLVRNSLCDTQGFGHPADHCPSPGEIGLLERRLRMVARTGKPRCQRASVPQKHTQDRLSTPFSSLLRAIAQPSIRWTSHTLSPPPPRSPSSLSSCRLCAGPTPETRPLGPSMPFCAGPSKLYAVHLESLEGPEDYTCLPASNHSN